MAAKIKKGDKVFVISGREKGQQGEVLKVLPREGKALISERNVVQRSQRQTNTSNENYIFKEMPIHLSNIALVDPILGRPTRVGFVTREDGRKVRFSKLSKGWIDD